MRWPILIALAAASPAAASPGTAPWDGAVFSGPTAPQPAGVAANPASALLTTNGLHVFVGGVGRLDQLAIDRRIVDESGASTAGPSVRGTTLGAGGHLGVLWWWRPSVVFTFTTGLPPPDETLAGEAALAYHTRGSRSRGTDLGTVALGSRLTSRIAIGVAVSYGWRSTVLRFARDTALEAGRDPTRGVASDCGGTRCGLEHPAAAETWTIAIDPLYDSFENLSLSGGLLVRLPGSILFGLTYQRPWKLGRLTRTGSATVIGAPRDGGTTWRGSATLFDRQPEVIRLGARFPTWPRWDLVGEVRWRRLGDLGADDVRTYGGDLAAGDVPEITPRPRGLRDAFTGELGIEEVERGQRLRLGARVGADSGAVSEEKMSARAVWGAELTAGAGAQLRLGSRWVVQLSYGLAYQLPATPSPSAFDPIDRLDCVDSGYDIALPACATVRGGYGAPTAAGSYERWSHVGRLSLRIEVP